MMLLIFPKVHVKAVPEIIILIYLCFSDAFDFQYGVVVIRLKEGLDISHIQGQGKSLFFC